MAPNIQTYHCLCTSLLLASTHTLSNLPRRAAPCLDNSLILPVVDFLSDSLGPDDADTGTEQDAAKNLPVEGYTKLLGMVADKKATLVRREDGFERRVVWRCSRCAVPVGYEIQGSASGKEHAATKVVYVLPGGMMSTEVMIRGKRVDEEDVVPWKEKTAAAWE